MGLLKIEELVKLDTRVKLHQIDISVLADYYFNYLNTYIYRFELKTGDIIEIDFSKENFCHLVGIEQIAEERLKRDLAKKSGKKINEYMYKGKRGFRKALKGELNFIHLKKLHSGAYKLQEDLEKFNFFHLIHKLIVSESVKVINFTKIPDSSITCDFIFHDVYDNALLHLGVEKSASASYFFPKTFFPRYLNQNNFDKFVEPTTQTAVSIVKIEVIEK